MPGAGRGNLRVNDPNDAQAVGDVVSRIAGRLRVDPRSIGGDRLQRGRRDLGEKGKSLRDAGSNILLSREKEGDKDGDGEGADSNVTDKRTAFKKLREEKERMKPAATVDPVAALTNECLLSMRVSGFELTGGTGSTKAAAKAANQAAGTKRNKHAPKTRGKLRYVCIVRTTNRCLLKQGGASANAKGSTEEGSMEEEDDLGYDEMFSPEDENGKGGREPENGGEISSGGPPLSKKKSKAAGSSAISTPDQSDDVRHLIASEDDIPVPPEDEISSFPSLVCLAIHPDGTNPEMRRILEMDKLVSIESVLPHPSGGGSKNKAGGEAGDADKLKSKGAVVLVFRTGDRVEIDCDLGKEETTTSIAPGAAAAVAAMRRERFLWSILQIHAILCTSVAEQNAQRAAGSTNAGRGGIRLATAAASSALLPLTVRNVDRAELQYMSTVNGFLNLSPALCALFERQRYRSGGGAGGDKHRAARDTEADEAEAKSDGISDAGSNDGMDNFAYDMMMGNYNRFAIFTSKDEEKDAEEILNDTPWQKGGMHGGGDDGAPVVITAINVDAAATADSLALLLQKRMRDLEAETCRRLIAWEDEKQFSATGVAPSGMQRDTVDALSLAALFNTLDMLDTELEDMEGWLREKAEAIRPLTDDCREIEEENRQLEQQWKSYDELGQELRRLLSGLEVPNDLQRILANPGWAFVYDPAGNIDVDASEAGVEDIYQAGRSLRDSIDRVEKEGGVHLRAVSERVEDLANVANAFCTSLAQIVVTVMEQLASDVVSSTDFTRIAKGENHTVIAKKVRDVSQAALSWCYIILFFFLRNSAVPHLSLLWQIL